jgi:hypothetical protein
MLTYADGCWDASLFHTAIAAKKAQLKIKEEEAKRKEEEALIAVSKASEEARAAFEKAQVLLYQ